MRMDAGSLSGMASPMNSWSVGKVTVDRVVCINRMFGCVVLVVSVVGAVVVCVLDGSVVVVLDV